MADAYATAVKRAKATGKTYVIRSGDTLARIPFQQVTLGGEPVDQAVLDLLHEAFPSARVSWIYASSEAGASIAVHDGKAGFPEKWCTQGTLMLMKGDSGSRALARFAATSASSNWRAVMSHRL